MHAPATLYRLRDRLALTRPELTTLLVVTALLGFGMIAQHLPSPPVEMSPDVLTYQARFAAASLEPETRPAAADAAKAEVGAEKDAPTRRVSKKAAPQRPVSINTATAAELETLPRVGPKMAQRILDYRAERGPFARVEDLRKVRGIGDKTLENLRPLITLD